MIPALLVGSGESQVTRKKREVRFLPRHQASSGVKLRWYQSGEEVNTGWEHYDFSQGRSSPHWLYVRLPRLQAAGQRKKKWSSAAPETSDTKSEQPDTREATESPAPTQLYKKMWPVLLASSLRHLEWTADVAMVLWVKLRREDLFCQVQRRNSVRIYLA